jgi:hypothetical protein
MICRFHEYLLFFGELQIYGTAGSTTPLRSCIFLPALKSGRSLFGYKFRTGGRTGLIFLIAFLFALIVILIQE